MVIKKDCLLHTRHPIQREGKGPAAEKEAFWHRVSGMPGAFHRIDTGRFR